MYSRKNNRSRFPGTGSPEYIERLRQCYPIHPEVFDRLFDDWSTYHNLQRTRGVLKLMAWWVNRLYHSGDDGAFIMPGDLPLNDLEISGEFISLLGSHWNPVIAEVESAASPATLRLSRTIFFGSRPSIGSKRGDRPRGLTHQHISLGAIPLGDSLSSYNKRELDHLVDKFRHLYREAGSRYYFDSDVDLTVVYTERKSEFNQDDDEAEIIRLIAEVCASVGGDAVVCPSEAAEVPDEATLRVVVLPPDQLRPDRGRSQDTATKPATDIVKYCIGGPREFPNALLFLSTGDNDAGILRDKARNILVWNSILHGLGKPKILLSEQREQEARRSLANSEGEFADQLAKAYVHHGVPHLDAQGNIGFSWNQQSFPEDGQLPDNLRLILTDDDEGKLLEAIDSFLGSRPDSHAEVDALWPSFARELGKPRLSSRQALVQAIQQGVQQGLFGLAQGYDVQSGTYENLYFQGKDIDNGTSVEDDALDIDGRLLVRREAVQEALTAAVGVPEIVDGSVSGRRQDEVAIDRMIDIVLDSGQSSPDMEVPSPDDEYGSVSGDQQIEVATAEAETPVVSDPAAVAVNSGQSSPDREAPSPDDKEVENTVAPPGLALGNITPATSTTEPVLPLESTESNLAVTWAELRFTLSSYHHAGQARGMGKVYVDDLKRDGCQVSIRIVTSSFLQLDEDGFDELVLPRRLFPEDDEGLDISVIFSASVKPAGETVLVITAETERSAGISMSIIRDMRRYSETNSFVELRLE